MIDPYRNINRIFVLSFKNDYDDCTRLFCDSYWMPLAERKKFNVLMRNKPFLIIKSVKTKQESYEQLL